MSGAVKDDPTLRQDLRIARSLGISLRRFWGWEPHTYTHDGRTIPEAEYDEWERALWRALEMWEQDRCPGCGQAMSESIWPAKKDRPHYRGGFHECSGCLAIEVAQIEQHRLDEQTRKARGKDAPPIPTNYRKWAAFRDPDPEGG